MPTALVTGTSTGIGQATAISLARKGYMVHAAMRNLDAAGPLSEAAAAEGLRIKPVAMDVDDDVSVTRCVAGVLDQDGRIDVLVNNAGIGGQGPVELTPLATYRQVMETNFFGALRCTQAVIPAMRRQGSGFIANISSVAGRVALSPHSPYAASKFAVEALSECLAQEMSGFGVRVVIVEPGVIATPIFGKIEPSRPDPGYPQERRLMALFGAVAPDASPPFEVGDLIAELAVNGNERFRYRVGVASTELIGWRESLSDTDWVALGGATDAEYAASMKSALGVDLSL
ncbi:SDR family oxidoreductase [Phenylobacterium sp.]|jgi:NAD(P)-dependent dehydrogenase (short-subunit alcohol dehydrogenase family)|uniref:SDR family oxidoreductase n=1 Tax=Phenylobacterium sp. TaxID=1871053 RepID=UPI002F42C689